MTSASGLDDAIAAEEASMEAEPILQNADKNERVTKEDRASIFKALRDYREFKKTHSAEVREYKKRYRKLKQALRESDSELNAALKITADACAQDKDLCRETQLKVLKPQYDAIMNPESFSWLDLFIPSAKAMIHPLVMACTARDPNMDVHFGHIIVYGYQKFRCYTPHKKMVRMDELVSIKTFGPGIWVNAEDLIIAGCLTDARGGINVGFDATAALVAGVQVAFFVGSNGLCSVLGYHPGIGGFAGLSLFKISNSRQ
jgi:hypothetical protein